jgi:peptidoglycan/LPS O-acetylase OafA/YrhL
MSPGNTSPTDSYEPAPGPKQRYRSLDGLRGVAAFVVLVCHSLLVAPALMQAHVDPSVISRGSLSWWATFSPLHLAWAGREAVYVFFVMSGFVLTLPFVHSGHRGWTSYYPKRLVRLYVPVWGAFALFLFWITVLPRNFSARDPLWLRLQTPVLTEASVRGDLLLLPAPSTNNAILWSLTVEVMFSLLLPLYVLMGRHFPKLNGLKVVLLLGLVAAFAIPGTTAYFFLPMFGLGTLMALERQRLGSLASRIRMSKYAPAVWWGLTITSLLLLNSYWTAHGITSDRERLAYLIPAAGGLAVFGACMAIFLAIEGPWRRWLEQPVLQWLGKRSFSLYLVHAPIVVSVGVLFGGSVGAPLTLAVAVPLSLAVAEVFYRSLERPSLRLSRAIGDRVELWRNKEIIPQLPGTVVVAEQ